MEEKQVTNVENCWELDDVDVAHNFKFYYLPFNSNEMHIEFKKGLKSLRDLQSASEMLTVLKTLKAPCGT